MIQGQDWRELTALEKRMLKLEKRIERLRRERVSWDMVGRVVEAS